MGPTEITTAMASLKEAARDLVHVAGRFETADSDIFLRDRVIGAMAVLAPTAITCADIHTAVDQVLEEEGCDG
ncbi:hypothetical protein [Synechococcus sp. LA31]|uniref:hypothetical protein n=1 Tax=Synechococcus sp. LA31 TaxID=2741953 RepID=UPI001BDDA9F3|nr:hypothetical protein [Synechococcus sp. LA31]QVV66784.1 hypothetical protein KJJ24_09835 [Synechococcus sp. LA31]